MTTSNRPTIPRVIISSTAEDLGTPADPEKNLHELLETTSFSNVRGLAEWRDAILLLVSALHKQGEAKVDDFVLRVLNGLQPSGGDLVAEARCAGLLGAVFRNLRPVGYVPSEPRYAELLDRVMAIFDPQRSQGVDLQVRIAAADALAQVGDPRLEHDAPGRWIPIPAGTFWMGAQNADPTQPNYAKDACRGEGPVHEVTLDAFEIGRFPVTVVEYRRFMEQGGYATEWYWSAGGFGLYTQPQNWAAQQEHPSRPVVEVSWYEAMAYCQWAECRLPTDAEWERAARGTTGRKFPWGHEPADETRLNCGMILNAATPVGIYPRGATPEGIEDLAGNVWEWCADWMADYQAAPQTNPTGPTTGAWRVFRGGSWMLGWVVARSAFRFWGLPGQTDGFIGFRVVRGSGVRTQ